MTTIYKLLLNDNYLNLRKVVIYEKSIMDICLLASAINQNNYTYYISINK